MNCDLKPLAQAIRDRRAILFVGAGASMSVGLPSWKKLIAHMLQELGIDTDAGGWPQNDYQTLAEYYRIRCGDIGPLIDWMSREWHVPRDRVAASEVHRRIVSLGFPTIYTTNYDHNLEVAYDLHAAPYARVVTPADLARAAPEATRIIKFHGDLDFPDSLVLTETDYFDRLSFDSALDMKFRADVLSNTVLFIGYSLSDMNIRLLLHRLWHTWRHAREEEHRPPSYVFMPRRKPVEEAVLQRWGVTMLTGEDAGDPQQALELFLRRLEREVAAFSPAASSPRQSPADARAR